MEPFKNKIAPSLVRCIAEHLEKHLKGFERKTFEAAVLKDLNKLELKQRIQLIATHLNAVLPSDHKARFKIIRAMLRPINNAPDDTQNTPNEENIQCDEKGVTGWGVLPLCKLVGQHSLDAFDEALDLLKDMTEHFSSEQDVRSFILADQPHALKIMTGWVHDPNYHVRRLASEGTRPRQPWATQLPQLIADPSPILPLLEALRDDEEEYVRRSVANNLNDIAKDHPDLVAEIAKRWMENADANRRRLLRHACRTLIKQGHPKTLKVFGVAPPKIDLKKIRIKTKTVTLGGDLAFTVDLSSTTPRPQALIIDYILHFKKANGAQAAKVFKWKNFTLPPHAHTVLEKSHPIKQITTRRYYQGRQGLSLRINGQDFGFEEFTLKIPELKKPE